MSHLSINLKVLRKKMGLSQEEIAKKLDFKRSTWGSYELSASKPEIDDIIRIANFFDITLDALLNRDLSAMSDDLINVQHLIDHPVIGKEGKENEKYASNWAEEPALRGWQRVPKVVAIDSSGLDNVTFVPAKARTEYLAGYSDPEFIKTLPTYRIPGLGNGIFRAFEVGGNSMVPTFHESDQIFGQFVENLEEISNNRVYVVLTCRDGVVVKRVINRILEDGKLILNSDNQRHRDEFPSIVLDPAEVLEIWCGILYFSRQMREPDEIYTRILNVESRLTLIEQGHKKLS